METSWTTSSPRTRWHSSNQSCKCLTLRIGLNKPQRSVKDVGSGFRTCLRVGGLAHENLRSRIHERPRARGGRREVVRHGGETHVSDFGGALPREQHVGRLHVPAQPVPGWSSTARRTQTHDGHEKQLTSGDILSPRCDRIDREESSSAHHREHKTRCCGPTDLDPSATTL